MNPLAQQHCRPLVGGTAMTADEIAAHLAQAPGWSHDGDAITKTYRFADYKEKVIDLLARVTKVSVETVAIVEAMRGAKR